MNNSISPGIPSLEEMDFYHNRQQEITNKVTRELGEGTPVKNIKNIIDKEFELNKIKFKQLESNVNTTGYSAERLHSYEEKVRKIINGDNFGLVLWKANMILPEQQLELLKTNAYKKF